MGNFCIIVAVIVTVNSVCAMAIAPIIVPATVKQSATIIFLHGLGDTGHGWCNKLARLKPDYAKLVCPTAPIRAITAYSGEEMPAWYDILSSSKKGQHEQSIMESKGLIESMIQDEITAGVPANRIVLGGFSQGAAMSLYTGLTGRYALAGVVALSGYLPLQSKIDWTKINTPPVLQCHGTEDGVVHYKIALKTKELLELHKYPYLEFKSYTGLDHSANDAVLRDIQEFFNRNLGNVTMRSGL